MEKLSKLSNKNIWLLLNKNKKEKNGIKYLSFLMELLTRDWDKLENREELYWLIYDNYNNGIFQSLDKTECNNFKNILNVESFETDSTEGEGRGEEGEEEEGEGRGEEEEEEGYAEVIEIEYESVSVEPKEKEKVKNEEFFSEKRKRD